MTNILIMDPDPIEQETLRKILERQYSPANLMCFSDPLLAVKFGANCPVDALYTVTAMKRMNGFELAKMLRSFRPNIQLHFIVDTEKEKNDAMRIMADSCTMRPVTAESLSMAAEAEW